ncbi:hypothetical protein KFU94_28285 [Chloroflexi bacterium TSY]|nr:hypothetical protein [Chloroflexi bacterium TSY]
MGSRDVEDMIVVTMRYEGGAIGSLEAGSAMFGRNPTPGQREINRIYGENGQIVLSARPSIYITQPYGDFPVGEWFPASEPPTESLSGRSLMIEHFAQAIVADTAPPVSGWDGRAALEIALAAYQSGKQESPVTLGSA